MLKLIKFTIILLLVFNVFSAGIFMAQSAPQGPTQSGATLDTVSNGLLPDQQTGSGPACPAGTTNCGNYSLNDMTSVAIKIANLILSVVGSLALLAFVAGGVMWMVSAGNPEWVTRGKQTIIGAVIGLAIVFTSYMIIQLVFTSLGIDATIGAWSTVRPEGGWLK